jgi:hypothetical protein
MEFEFTTEVIERRGQSTPNRHPGERRDPRTRVAIQAAEIPGQARDDAW